LTDIEASWVSSLASIGFVIGGLASGLFMRVIGRKYSSLFGLGFSYVIGYALIAFAPTKEFIYSGRFFGGLCQVRNFHEAIL
jgi:MFS family permease